MNTQPETWKRIESEEVANCRIFKIRRDTCARASGGARHDFFVIENTDWVNVIPVTKQNEVVLIEQFRHGSQEITLEIPGGMIDSDEDATFAAGRELIEETGYEPREIIFLGKSRPNPATHDNWVYHFLASDCEKVRETAFDSTESIVTTLVPFDEIPNLIAGGRITHALVVTAFYWYSLYNQRS